MKTLILKHSHLFSRKFRTFKRKQFWHPHLKTDSRTSDIAWLNPRIKKILKATPFHKRHAKALTKVSLCWLFLPLKSRYSNKLFKFNLEIQGSVHIHRILLTWNSPNSLDCTIALVVTKSNSIISTSLPFRIIKDKWW